MKSPNSSPKLQATTTRTARPPGTLGIAGTCALLLATYPTQTYAASPPHSPAKPAAAAPAPTPVAATAAAPATAASRIAPPAPPAVRVAEIAPPARPLAPAAGGTTPSGPAVTVSRDGVTWLTWLERNGGTLTLLFATFDATNQLWTPARSITSGADLYAGNSDFPALSAGPHGTATAVWFVSNPSSSATVHLHHGAGYRAYFSRTADLGKTWSPPALVSRESTTTEFFSLATLPDGRVLAAWLDGRTKADGGKKQQLFSRFLGREGPDTLVDPSVCDCCHTALTAFPDGSALLVYRGRSDDEIRDLRVTRWRHNQWEESRPLNQDGWKIAGCPVNGPQIASDGGRVAVAWFTAADNDQRVLASFSSDAGGRFLMPLRINDAKTAGRVATVLLHDGAFLVSHLDGDGALALRRITPDFATGETTLLATSAQGQIKGFPRLALLRDYTGGKSPAQVIATFAREGSAQVHSLLITVPEGDLLEAEKNCDCSPTVEQLQGFFIRGSVLATQPAEGTVRVRHFDVPGIFPEGERDFKAHPESLAKAGTPGRQFLGRIEERAGTWWLFDVRLIGPPVTP
jgi:hypothetical protein